MTAPSTRTGETGHGLVGMRERAALIGGTLMGIGARVAKGCNIGAFFSTVTNGDPSGWLFLLGMAAGAWVGVKLFAWWVDWQAARQGGELTL